MTFGGFKEPHTLVAWHTQTRESEGEGEGENRCDLPVISLYSESNTKYAFRILKQLICHGVN